jgi:hypothetical protein
MRIADHSTVATPGSSKFRTGNCAKSGRDVGAEQGPEGDDRRPAQRVGQTETAYIGIKKLSVFSQESQRYVISSNLGLQGSESINRIFLPHVVHGSSVTRKCAQVGVGRCVGSIVASRIWGIRNATNKLILSASAAL